MYFQVANTPENIRRKKDAIETVGSKENPRLILAPFSAAPVVTFENINVGADAIRVLEVLNPGSSTLQLSVSKHPPPCLGLQLSWLELSLPGNTLAELVLSWSPMDAVGQRVSLQITDQRKGRYDVIIVCKSQLIKKVLRRKAASIISKSTIQKKSPKQLAAKRLSPKRKTVTLAELKRYGNNGNIEAKLSCDSSVTYRRTGHRVTTQRSGADQLTWDSGDEMSRRETYIINNDVNHDKENTFCFQRTPPYNKFSSNGKQRGKTPSPGLSVLSAIENLHFTPSKVCEKIFNKQPVCLDTPNNHNPEFTFSKNMDSFIDNLEFTPLKKCETQSRINVNRLLSTETVETCVEHVKQYVTVNNHYYKENSASKLDEFHFTLTKPDDDCPGTENVMTQDKENVTMCRANNPVININVTHPIIDLRDTSYISGPDASYYGPEIPSAAGNGMERMFNYSDFNAPPINVNDFSKSLARPCHEYSMFTPNKNFGGIDDSMKEFLPKRCSTERKDCNHSTCQADPSRVCKDLLQMYSPGNACDNLNTTYGKLSTDTYTKGDSPIVPIDPSNRECLQSSPYSADLSPLNPLKKNSQRSNCPRKLPFSETSKNFNERVDVRNAAKEKNSISGVKEILEANMWQQSPPRSISPSPLASIPEESIMSDSSVSGSRKAYCETFILDKTFDKLKPVIRPVSIEKTWRKTCSKLETLSKKQPVAMQRISTFTEAFADKQSLSVMVADRGKMETCAAEQSYHSERIMNETYEYVNIRSMATTVDPFMASTCLYDEKAYDEMENEFKMWLNYLLTPPADLDTNMDNTKIDIGKAWLENRNRQVPAAPTNEQVSSQYHTSHRLESLRKTAKTFVASPAMTQVFMKVCNQVERKFLSIRADKNVHLDIGLQKIILNLLLCYNPLWLRIGLETLYNKHIPLSSNNDIMGLSGFIIERMFKDPYIGSKHANPAIPNVHLPSYMETIKKFTLKKFLFLVYFLDQAKLNKIILHDPCLFRRNAPYKESREILIQFTKELLSGVGDITKHLKPTGYVVYHKQTYLNEFKYAVHNLATDLKDGVRLTRLMEIILLKENLTSCLRTPAISRLQKIHNVKIALTALEHAGFVIVGDITAKDIADGHREKTLSLLWQLINKFRAPLFDNAAFVIQKWWRRKYLNVWIQNRIEAKKHMRLYKAAVLLQSWWKKIVCRRIYLTRLQYETNASIILQKNWKMWSQRKRYRTCVRSAVKIQKWYRKIKVYQTFKLYNKDRDNFLKMRSGAVCIQRHYRACKARRSYLTLRRTTIQIQQYYRAILVRRTIQKYFIQLRYSAIIVQRRYRANKLMNVCSAKYIEQKRATVTIQHFYRSYRLMKIVWEDYQALRAATVLIQQKYRAILYMRAARKLFVQVKKGALIIQTHVRAHQQMNKARSIYLKQRHSAVIIQRYYRAYIAKQTIRKYYLQLKCATIYIQHRFRANKLMLEAEKEYRDLKHATLIIQRLYRSIVLMRLEREQYVNKYNATVLLQRAFRAKKDMVNCKQEYTRKRLAIITIQHWYRSVLIMRKIWHYYISLKASTVCIQSLFRAKLVARTCRSEYLQLKEACVSVQMRYRANIKMRQDYQKYQQVKSATITIQSYYRAHVSRNTERERYLQLKKITITLQRIYRNRQVARQCKIAYLSLRSAAVLLQQKYRARLATHRAVRSYTKLRHSAIVLQTYYRAYATMKRVRTKYLMEKHSAITIQRYYRAYRFQIIESNKYLDLKYACINIQRRYRALLAMRQARHQYIQLKHASVTIQHAYKSLLMMRTQRYEFLQLCKSVICIQRRFRAQQQMIHDKNQYDRLKLASLTIQRIYRACVLMKLQQQQYHLLQHSAVCIQRYFRAWQLMICARNRYKTIKQATITIQKTYRSVVLMRSQRRDYLQICKATICIQRHFRASLLMIEARSQYNGMRRAAITVQRRYRDIVRMRFQKVEYKQLYQATLCIQRQFRARNLMICERNNYNSLRKAAITIQKVFKSILLMRVQRKEYLQLCKFTLSIQRRFRANQNMKQCKRDYKTQRMACITIQQWYTSVLTTRSVRFHYVSLRMYTICMQRRHRANLQTRSCQQSYQKLRNACICIQKRYRANILMRHDYYRYNSIKCAVITIQKWFRALSQMKVERQRYITLRATTIFLQKTYRNAQVTRYIRDDYLSLRSAATIIQQRFRAKMYRDKALKKYSLQRKSSIIIQRFIRSYHQMKMARMQYLRQRRSAVLLQRYYRSYAAAKRAKDVKQLAETLEVQEKRIKNQAATIIQSYWRGYVERKQCSSECVAKLRQRWRDGALESQQLTLAERTEDALSVLCHFRDVASVIRAFKTLEYITNVYPMMYGSHELAVPVVQKLVLYMDATNRSVSTLETLQHGVAILLNLAKYQPTAHYVYSEHNIKTLLMLMLRWCDKDDLLSRQFCTLFWVLGKYDDIRKEISRFLQCSEQYKILCRVQELLLRKRRMDINRRQPTPLGRSPKRSTSHSFCMPHTPARGRGLLSPTTEPDYGIPRSDRPRLFLCSTHAINAVFEKFNLPLNIVREL